MTFPRFVTEVHEMRIWVNHQTGARASFYGARPHGPGWAVKVEGYTLAWDNGTVGGPMLARMESRSDVVTYANHVNARERDRLAARALEYPEQADHCAAMARDIPGAFV